MNLDLLRIEARHFGIRLSDHQMSQFRIYLDELWDWNRHINLIGVDSRTRVAMELFLDSLIPVPYIPLKGMMLDVGSGAGFPGLPLKICLPGYDLHIVEPNARKAGFLKQVIRLLELEGIQVFHGRIEECGPDLSQTGYDVVTAKALAPFNRTISLCASFVGTGGLFVGYLGSGSDQALKDAEMVIDEHGMSLFRKVPYQIPGKESMRWIFLMRKEV